ncbi:MAG TPA: hypothetical protein VMH82_06935 [Myxococcota bacterium]|nr:hypothetical protein [Myxococcota bacterium]
MRMRFAIGIFTAAAVSMAQTAARADLAPWDQAKVTALAKQLATAAGALNDTFYRQPVPSAGSAQTRGYERLKQAVMKIQREAKSLNAKLAAGADRQATTNSYQDLMQTVNSAREDAKGVFAGADVSEKATAVRGVLNQLGPFYDPDFKELHPVTR